MTMAVFDCTLPTNHPKLVILSPLLGRVIPHGSRTRVAEANMTKHDESIGPEGYQVDAVEAWIETHIDGLTPPFKWTR